MGSGWLPLLCELRYVPFKLLHKSGILQQGNRKPPQARTLCWVCRIGQAQVHWGMITNRKGVNVCTSFHKLVVNKGWILVSKSSETLVTTMSSHALRSSEPYAPACCSGTFPMGILHPISPSVGSAPTCTRNGALLSLKCCNARVAATTRCCSAISCCLLWCVAVMQVG